jgi:pimeloyl-ACP methyl ester carboxylesterase
VVLVPGAFCTASVMNRLGDAIERNHRRVCLAPTFPYYLSAAANTCRIERAARLLVAFLDGLADRDGVTGVDVVAHSNGGLITLIAQDLLEHGALRSRVPVRRLITLATPFGGFPFARALSPLLPFCADLLASSETLARAARHGRLVTRTLVAGADSLIPPENQFLDLQRRVIMAGFQHMDFIVGDQDKVKRTAAEVTRWLA